MLSDEQIEAIALEHESFGFGRADERGLTTHGFDHNGLRAFVRAIESALSQSTEQGERDAEETLRWCNHCGEGVTTFCRGKSEACPMQLKKLRAAMSPHGDGGRG